MADKPTRTRYDVTLTKTDMRTLERAAGYMDYAWIAGAKALKADLEKLIAKAKKGETC